MQGSVNGNQSHCHIPGYRDGLIEDRLTLISLWLIQWFLFPKHAERWWIHLSRCHCPSTLHPLEKSLDPPTGWRDT